MLRIFSLFVLVFIATACSKQTNENQTVISWNASNVSSAEFKTQFVRNISTAPIEDSYESREKYARVLLERKVIADYASSFSYDTISFIQQAINLTQELAAARYFLRDKTEEKIELVTEEDLQEAFRVTHSSVHLQQIYATSESEILDYHRALSVDISSFDELASQSMINAGEAPLAYNMGWVNWNDMDLKPEEVAFSLEIGEVSEPVQSLSGWHIFKLVDKTETFFADQTTFQNSREVLEDQLIRRRFEEENIRYINSVLSETPIEFYPSSIEDFWISIEPQIPNSRDEILRLMGDSEEIVRKISPESPITLARLDGNDITSTDFIDRLPSIPYWQLNSNLRPAIETIAKDILFAKKAKDQGFYNHPEVLKEKEVERVRQLYNVFTADVSDTINISNHIEDWFEEYSENYIQDIEIDLISYSFESQSEAQLLLDDYRITNDWDESLSRNTSFSQSEVQTLNYSTNLEHPVFGINNTNNLNGLTQLWGPFEIDNSWSFIQILDREQINYNLTDVEERVLTDMRLNLPSLVHSVLLNRIEFSQDEAIINPTVLQEVLPIYFD